MPSQTEISLNSDSNAGPTLTIAILPLCTTLCWHFGRRFQVLILRHTEEFSVHPRLLAAAAAAADNAVEPPMDLINIC